MENMSIRGAEVLERLTKGGAGGVRSLDRFASACDRRCGADAGRRLIDERALRSYGWRGA